jgi:hypothetical protein
MPRGRASRTFHTSWGVFCVVSTMRITAAALGLSAGGARSLPGSGMLTHPFPLLIATEHTQTATQPQIRKAGQSKSSSSKVKTTSPWRFEADPRTGPCRLRTSFLRLQCRLGECWSERDSAGFRVSLRKTHPLTQPCCPVQS